MFQPEKELEQRDTHIIFLCDCSGSMTGEKLENVNESISAALQEIKRFTNETGNLNSAAISASVVRYSDIANWHIPPSNFRGEFTWSNLQNPAGLTNLGQAYYLLSEWLQSPQASTSNLIMIMVTDGMPTDEPLLPAQWTQHHQKEQHFERIAFALGSEAESSYLDEFVSEEDNLYVLRNELMLKELLSRALSKAVKKLP